MSKKAAIALGASLAGLGLIVLSQKKEAIKPPPEGTEAGAGVSIGIRDAVTGLPVPTESPAVVAEGRSYFADITVKNTSTRLGQLVPADFYLPVSGMAGNQGISFTPQEMIWHAAAGGTETFTYPFTVPPGTALQSGKIAAALQDPNRNTVAVGQELLYIYAVTYKATLLLNLLLPAEGALEGQSGYVPRFVITNLSAISGLATWADLTIDISGLAGNMPLVWNPPATRWTRRFLVGESLAYEVPTFGVPEGTGGQVGVVGVAIADPANNQVAVQQVQFTIQSAAIIYTGTITIGVR